MHGHSLFCMVYVLYIIDRARPLKLFHFASAFTFQTWNRGNANANANERIKKTQVLSFPCHHGAVKLKARWRLPFYSRNWQRVQGNIRCFIIKVVQIIWRKLLPEKIWQKNWDQKTACFTTEDINSKYAQWISNCLQYKLIFLVALNRYLQFLVRKPRKVDLLWPKLKAYCP